MHRADCPASRSCICVCVARSFLTTSYWSRSVGSSPVRPGAGSVHHLTTTASAASPLGVPATGTGALANPDWYRQLLSQSANEHKPPLSPPGAPATGSESDDSSSSSSSSDDSSQSRSDSEKKKGSKRGARESASKGQGKSGGDVHKAPKGGEESAPVESLRETARRVSTQVRVLTHTHTDTHAHCQTHPDMLVSRTLHSAVSVVVKP